MNIRFQKNGFRVVTLSRAPDQTTTYEIQRQALGMNGQQGWQSVGKVIVPVGSKDLPDANDPDANDPVVADVQVEDSPEIRDLLEEAFPDFNLWPWSGKVTQFYQKKEIIKKKQELESLKKMEQKIKLEQDSVKHQETLKKMDEKKQQLQQKLQERKQEVLEKKKELQQQSQAPSSPSASKRVKTLVLTKESSNFLFEV